MSDNTIVIREIRPEDNPQIEAIIKGCFPEFNIPLKGTAYEDAETPFMYESYQGANEVYYVLANETEVYGGGGIKPLKGYKGNLCELQKMYFSPTLRGQGHAKVLLSKCLETAKTFGYDACYLETAPQLKVAVHLYESFGFEQLSGPLGHTGHFACGVWMLKGL